jgi:hypothetical protein
LENDRSLARFAGQFVPLKIVTDGNPEWNKWARKYPIDGAGIPRLYVVRADGEQLYGEVGSLPGDQLPSMMLATLNKAGRAFSDAESQLLEQAVSAAAAALDAGDPLAASHALSAAQTLGPPDALQSYAQPALAAGQLYQRLQAELDAKVQSALDELQDAGNEDPLDALIVIHEAAAVYQLFPPLKSKAVTITRDLKQNKSYAQPYAQAEALVRARSLKASQQQNVRKRAAAAYASVMRRYPQSRVEQLAREELAEIDPDAKALQAMNEPDPPEAFRQWTARSGKFTTTARYLQHTAGKVQLLKEDGKTIVVDIAVLSDEDQAYLRQRP